LFPHQNPKQLLASKAKAEISFLNYGFQLNYLGKDTLNLGFNRRGKEINY